MPTVHTPHNPATRSPESRLCWRMCATHVCVPMPVCHGVDLALEAAPTPVTEHHKACYLPRLDRNHEHE